MHTADLLTFFVFLFQFLLGLTSASYISWLPTSASSLSPDSRVTLTPVARRDDDHLCNGLTDITYEYGDQSNQTGIVLDCTILTQHLKAITADQGKNLTEQCAGLPPPSKARRDSKARGDFTLVGSEGSCSLWLKCLGNDSQNEVTLGWNDIGDIMIVAIDGLNAAPGYSKNSSILSASASTECQQLQTDWMLKFDNNN